LYDRLGPGFTLVGPVHDGHPGVAGLVEHASRWRIPLSLAEPPPSYSWRTEFLLVRPDQHIAWRAADPPTSTPMWSPDTAAAPRSAPGQ